MRMRKKPKFWVIIWGAKMACLRDVLVCCKVVPWVCAWARPSVVTVKVTNLYSNFEKMRSDEVMNCEAKML